MDLSYERESQWRPHLSWTFSSCSLQQQMEEQAAQRELAWQKLTDRLGSIMIADGGGYRTFMESDYKPARSLFSFDEEEQDYQEEQKNQERNIHQQSQQEPYQYQHQFHKKQEKYCKLSISGPSFKQQKQNQNREQPNTNNNNNEYTSIAGVDDENQDYYEHYKKAKRKCLTVSTILVSLTMLLFTIVILMAIGIVHR